MGLLQVVSFSLSHTLLKVVRVISFCGMWLCRFAKAKKLACCIFRGKFSPMFWFSDFNNFTNYTRLQLHALMETKSNKDTNHWYIILCSFSVTVKPSCHNILFQE